MTAVIHQASLYAEALLPSHIMTISSIHAQKSDFNLRMEGRSRTRRKQFVLHMRTMVLMYMVHYKATNTVTYLPKALANRQKTLVCPIVGAAVVPKE